MKLYNICYFIKKLKKKNRKFSEIMGYREK